jgi:hypothetical protein
MQNKNMQNDSMKKGTMQNDTMERGSSGTMNK